MHRHAREQAERCGVPLELLSADAAHTGLPDASVDAVVSTLVLCSVPDLPAVLREVRRILRPGGRLLCVEHVAALAGTRLRLAQDVLRPLWSLCADGCQLDRDTEAAIRAAGFAHAQFERFSRPAGPVSPHIAGWAER